MTTFASPGHVDDTPHPFAELHGAVVLGDGGIAHFGQPLREQRALAEGRGVALLQHHGVVTVSGADRLAWLHTMTSGALEHRSPHDAAESLLLDPNGRIEHVLRVVDDGEVVWLLVDPGHAAPLTTYLQRMRFASRVEVVDRSDEMVTALVFGEPGHRLLSPLAVASWRDPWEAVQEGGVQYATADPHPATGWSASQVIIPRGRISEVVSLARAGQLSPAGQSAVDGLEIQAWRPSQRAEVDERAIPHEFDWMRTAVHLNKGCYRGQETVAKVHNLGHPPRRLTMLHLEGANGDLPDSGALVYVAEGAEVGASSRPVGRVTRAATHMDWGDLALALLKRSVPEGAALVVDAADGNRLVATQEVIVPSSAGAAAPRPNLRRTAAGR